MAREVDFLIRLNNRGGPKKSLEYYLEGSSSSSNREKDDLYRARFAEFKEDVIEEFGPDHLTRAQQEYLFDHVRANHGLSHYEIYEGYRALSSFLTGLNEIMKKDNS